jgi:hypothetical protein
MRYALQQNFRTTEPQLNETLSLSGIIILSRVERIKPI